MAGPATILGSMTGHGGSVVGPGCPTVLINNMPAIRIGADMHVCPMVTPATPPIPHIGMNNIGPGVPTVFIGGMPASTVGDNFLCAGPPTPVVTGAFNVLIGTGAGGGGGGSGAGAADASAANALKAGKISPIKGTETFPIEIQAALIEAQPHMAPDAMEQHIQTIADALAESEEQTQDDDSLSIADVIEILEAVEREEGFESARFFASYLDYGTLTELTMAFISGDDANPDNDPNLMPTRYMILYGADDSKLQQIDESPDCHDGEAHIINVGNLRKSLIGAGYDISENGPYDDEVYGAHVSYLAEYMENFALEELEEGEENQNGSDTQGPSVLGQFQISFEIDPADQGAEKYRFSLYSTDMKKCYCQTKTVKDDAGRSNKTLDLVFTNVNENLNYTLEYDEGPETKITTVFRNRPYGKWLS